PKALWNHFADLNAVPRPSKKEERVTAFMKDFGESLGLETIVDEVGNVLIKKPASPGMEGRKTIALQGHIDMVHQKNADTDFDFNTEGIKMYVDGDWVKARGTTLGADNGIGVAAAMTILSSSDIPHPPIEALFTIDEETGMTGAKALKGGLMSATVMLNLDTEDDTELTIGCAGGIDVTATAEYAEVPVPGGHEACRVGVKSLKGGHSGMEIHLGRGNANKLMNRLLHGAQEKFGIAVSSIDGGGLRNAIPRESFATVTVPAGQMDAFRKYLDELEATLKAEYHTTDPDLELTFEKVSSPAKVMAPDFQHTFLRAVYACPNGIYRMSPEIEGLVQTSNNVARILAENGSVTVQCLTRGSVDSEKMDLAEAIKSTFELTAASVVFAGAYPGWEPKPGSSIVKLMSNLYEEMFHNKADVNACHAGLECGILGTNYPNMEMISFGPNIRGAHSPDEKVQISSVQKFWKYLLETIKRVD
ncbi:MAG: aminoacyl-histidine dipeptidase, partial [Saprospiraceae bacterium]